jgi:hypothetical protein
LFYELGAMGVTAVRITGYVGYIFQFSDRAVEFTIDVSSGLALITQAAMAADMHIRRLQAEASDSLQKMTL